jgi:hypothetical protein
VSTIDEKHAKGQADVDTFSYPAAPLSLAAGDVISL